MDDWMGYPYFRKSPEVKLDFQRVLRVCHMIDNSAMPMGKDKLALFSLVELILLYFALEPFGAVVYVVDLDFSHRSFNAEPDT